MNNQLKNACEIGDLAKVKELVNNGAVIHANNEYALRWASFKGHIDVVTYLKRVVKLRKCSI